MWRIFFIGLFGLSAQQAYAQSNQRLLFTTETGADAEFITYALGADFSAPRRLCRNLPYWYADYTGRGDGLEKLRAVRGVLMAQTDKRIENRFVPDDTWFINQIHLQLIQAHKAWDYTRDGVTARGDTLVVAIIDTGADTLHPDLVNNLWINRGEIPWNGIDDDKNGYIDDYRGWNAMDDNPIVVDRFDLARHGTGVTGIVGAEGNNRLGVAGILFNVKLMQVVGSGASESDVLRAFDYVLTQKKRWISSGGKEGAMVVSANNSWGIDRGRPADAPLWCAFYDTLGYYGILTAAATVNGETDVDRLGDLPTTCPSPYLIAVNNVDASDRYYSSGFGIDNIDIAAPGEATFTTVAPPENNVRFGKYDQFSGTSGASPQVAAAVALLLSHACDSFLHFYETQPKAALLCLRLMILNSADKNTSLYGRNASGGRLNLLRALSLMNRWCSNAWSVSEYRSVELQFLQNGRQLRFWSPENGTLNFYLSDGRLFRSLSTQSGQWMDIDAGAWPSGIFMVSYEGMRIRGFSRILIP
jgi:subtilisin family serine protease